MSIASFDDLLHAARRETEPQRLLLVFTAAELPSEATLDQRARFELGEGGALSPLVCVDKAPEELRSFDELREESRRAGPPWDIVFVAALSGRAGRGPTNAEIEAALQRMVDSIQSGSIANFIPFDMHGHPVRFG